MKMPQVTEFHCPICRDFELRIAEIRRLANNRLALEVYEEAYAEHRERDANSRQLSG
jgi:hypothetical protein